MAKLIRTFVALPIPEPVVRQLAHLQRTLTRRLPQVRWVEPDNFHATLCFLGEVADIDLNAICKTVGDVAKQFERVEVVVGGVGAFPSPQRPRVVWAGLVDESDTLKRIHHDLATAFAKLGYRSEEPRFHPHVTLGRLRNDRGSATDLTPIVEQHREWSGGAFQAREIVVFSSDLGSEGPTYTPLSRVPLRKRMSGSNS